VWDLFAVCKWHPTFFLHRFVCSPWTSDSCQSIAVMLPAVVTAAQIPIQTVVLLMVKVVVGTERDKKMISWLFEP
jgi:hypothetical protein